MDHIEFDTTVEGEGVIRIPDDLKRGIARGEHVHVTLSPEPKERLTVKRMRENPIPAPGFKPLSREEIYNRAS